MLLLAGIGAVEGFHLHSPAAETESHCGKTVPLPAAASLAAEGLEEQDAQAAASAADVEVLSASEGETLSGEAVQVRCRWLQRST